MTFSVDAVKDKINPSEIIPQEEQDALETGYLNETKRIKTK